MYGKIRKLFKKAVGKIKRLFEKPPRMKFLFGWYYKYASVKENRVLFESFHGKDISDSPLYILMELLKNGDAQKYEIYFATNKPDYHRKQAEALNLPVKLVFIGAYKYPRILATSKYLINNSSFPAYFIRKPDQIYLQTWHGTPLKTLGKKMRFGIESMYNVQHNFLQANYIMFPNEFTRDVMMEDYNLNHLFTGKVVMNGYPRNTIFSDKDKAGEICRKLQNENYTTMAYMPTWRGVSNHDIRSEEQGKETGEMLKYLDDHMKDNQKLYVNFHPIVQGSVKLEGYKHILPFPMEVDKYEFLNSVDVLITDYSSVLFDFSVTRKPIILFMYDYEEYMHDRGMYFDIKELPFRKIYDIKELANCIVDEEFRGDSYENNTAYINKFIQYDSIEAGKAMAELVFDGKTDHVPIIDYSKNKIPERNVIFPPAIKTTGAIDAVAKTVDKKRDIVVFERRFFNPTMSSYLHDNYPDDFDYVFVTRTVPRTFLEELFKGRNAKVREQLLEREIRRCFMDLNIKRKFQTDYYHGEQDESFYFEKIPAIQAEASVEDGTLTVDFSASQGLDPVKFLVVNSEGYIFWTRHLSDSEIQSGVIRENFSDYVDARIAANNGRYLLALEVREKSGKATLRYLINTNKFQNAKQVSSELDESAFYMDSLIFEECYFRNGAVPEKIAVTPYMNQKTGRLSILTCLEEEVVSKYRRAQVKDFSAKGSVAHIIVQIKKSEWAVAGMELVYRSKVEDVSYPMKCRIQEGQENLTLHSSIDMSEIKLQEVYWDVNVVLRKEGKEIKHSCYLSKIQKLKLLIMNYQCAADEEHIIFPYKTKGGKIAWSYRVKSAYDGRGTRIKEFTAFAVYALLLPYWKKKRMWLVFEKFCSMAQDNGYYFFKYCMEQLPQREKRHIYYILDKNSADWDKVQQYGRQVIPFMSFKHILYCMVAKLYVASDSKSHLYAWRAKPNLISQRIAKHDILFLQHGVTALKRVDSIFGKRGSSPMTYFTTTSEYEQNIVVENFGYTPETAPILGFTRWDVLEDTSTEDEKIILAMPTWRSWLEEKSADDFRESDYYRNYMHFLQSERLSNVLAENHVKLIFYIHPKFKDYLSEFNISGDNVELIPFGDTPLNEIIKKCSMLITDYSSVCWDVYYLGKPVLFYQFDCDLYRQAHGSYMDMDTELFGERYMECDDLIEGIGQYIRNGFEEKKEYSEMRNYYFTYRDNDNSKRTYEYIVSQELLKKDGKTG